MDGMEERKILIGSASGNVTGYTRPRCLPPQFQEIRAESLSKVARKFKNTNNSDLSESWDSGPGEISGYRKLTGILATREKDRLTVGFLSSRCSFLRLVFVWRTRDMRWSGKVFAVTN